MMMEININNNPIAKRVGIHKSVTFRMPTSDPQDILDEARSHITAGDEIVISSVQGGGSFDNNFETEVKKNVIRTGRVMSVTNGKIVVDWQH